MSGQALKIRDLNGDGRADAAFTVGWTREFTGYIRNHGRMVASRGVIMALAINGGYDRSTIREEIPGVHPQLALTQVRDEVGGLVLMLKQHTAYPYSNAFDTSAREFWMDINEDDSRANGRLRNMTPIRLFFWRTTAVHGVSAYRYLGYIEFSRQAVREGRTNFVFRLLNAEARISDLPQLQPALRD